jgi:hypothetical protein
MIRAMEWLHGIHQQPNRTTLLPNRTTLLPITEPHHYLTEPHYYLTEPKILPIYPNQPTSPMLPLEA